MELPPFDGVIFDLDGTLYHMKWYMRPLFYLRLFPHGRWLVEYMKVRAEAAGKDRGTEFELLNELSDSLARRVDCDTASAFAWICRSFYPAFVSLMRLSRGSRPGVGEVLGSLRRRGCRTGVLSDFGMVAPRLHGLGIDPGHFDTLLSAEGQGALKPASRCFRALAQAWGIPCERVVVVGDRDDTDGEGARRSGMAFLRISDAVAGRRPQGACSWHEVAALLTNNDAVSRQ